ncbi:hypothetical protein J4456_01860 [Candidatus Pacearchaeota archaeon]|nr:hypothetical protein [Candidatus Pacearchaeota archaeon]
MRVTYRTLGGVDGNVYTDLTIGSFIKIPVIEWIDSISDGSVTTIRFSGLGMNYQRDYRLSNKGDGYVLACIREIGFPSHLPEYNDIKNKIEAFKQRAAGI